MPYRSWNILINRKLGSNTPEYISDDPMDIDDNLIDANNFSGDISNIMRMKVSDIRTNLKHHNININGRKKKALAESLFAYLKTNLSFYNIH